MRACFGSGRARPGRGNAQPAAVGGGPAGPGRRAGRGAPRQARVRDAADLGPERRGRQLPALPARPLALAPESAPRLHWVR